MAIRYSLITKNHCSRILIQFNYNGAWNKRMQQLDGAKWSHSLNGWHIPDTQVNRIKCGLSLQALPDSKVKAVETQHVNKNTSISPNNKQQMERYLQTLQLKAYSSSTIKTYCNEFAQLLQAIGNYEVQRLTSDQLRRYLQHCLQNGCRENTVHSRINAIKFYFEVLLKKEKFFYDIPRPKKPLQLPKLLNEDEIRRLFNALTNRKHKAMLFTAYSAGLRVSEIVHLKLADIDGRRMQIFIENAKGKKDRYVNLSPVLLDLLRQYFKCCKPRPTKYLFESEQTLSMYPVRTVQQIFTNAKRKAGIHKEVGIHSLRHSFATHLLDKGTDIRYIKELLGHFNIKTTERYLHVGKQKLVNIISPFDDLMKNQEIEW